MSNGDPDPISGAPYIIICSGRTEVALSNDYDSKVLAASRCAARFAAFMGLTYPSSADFVSDLRPTTTIQHQLMNHAIGTHSLSHSQLDQKFVDLFAAMSEMEGEYS
jgi:hypothetical protein